MKHYRVKISENNEIDVEADKFSVENGNLLISRTTKEGNLVVIAAFACNRWVGIYESPLTTPAKQ